MTDIAPATDPRLQTRDPLDGEVEDVVGLSLSGGGYKAALFHLGALIRLNQLGALPKLSRISSVSGGSITSAWLALNWSKLTFDATGRATNFDTVIRRPFERFCAEAKIDVQAGLVGVLNPFSTTGETLEAAYEKRLFGKATLQDLPDPALGAPTFVFNATNMQLNSLWRFSRKRAADHRIGEILAPTFSLAKVVAASSGFPPIFSPVVFRFEPGTLKPFGDADRATGDYLRFARVADGGIYDNLGLEAIWKRCRTVLVSNAGDPFEELASPPGDWLGQLRRVISIMHRQCENHRLRWLIALAKGGHRVVASWSLRSRVAPYGVLGTLALSAAEAAIVDKVAVRLWPPSDEERRLLIRHGFSLTDAAVRRFWLKTSPPPEAWP
jgi:NTE family protein